VTPQRVGRSVTELVEAAYEALRRRDIEGFLAIVDPDVEFVSLTLETEGAFRGHDGVRRFLTDLLETMPDWDPRAEEIVAEGERVLVRARVRASGARSEVPLDQVMWQAAEVRDEKVVWWRFFRTEEDARATLRSRAAGRS
jgi:ketosteroid isomerase-like protein